MVIGKHHFLKVELLKQRNLKHWNNAVHSESVAAAPLPIQAYCRAAEVYRNPFRITQYGCVCICDAQSQGGLSAAQDYDFLLAHSQHLHMNKYEEKSNK